MKHRKKKKYTGFKLLFIIIVIIALYIYFGKKYDKPIPIIPFIDNHEYQNNIVNETSEELDENLKTFLINFYNTYYRSMKELKEYDMTSFFSNQNEAALNQTSLELLIKSRKSQLNDLSLKKVKYDLNITKIKNNDDSIYIELNEDSYLDFAFLNYTSTVYDILNTFDIVKENDEYKIKNYYKEQGHFVMVSRLLDKSKDYTPQLETIKNNYIDLFSKEKENQNKLYEEYLNNKNKTFKKCDYGYDRDKAIEYALKYVNTRDPNVPRYDDGGGNCQNYASWSIHNGGIPMDTTGTYQWKNIDGNKTASWTAVGYFYNYVKNNGGSGICGEVDVNPYYAQNGDVVQVGYGGTFRHTALVIDTFKKDDNVIDVILSSNTGDLVNYPLSAYVYPEKRLIKILGYN